MDYFLSTPCCNKVDGNFDGYTFFQTLLLIDYKKLNLIGCEII
jgi:hypothetical protein